MPTMYDTRRASLVWAFLGLALLFVHGCAGDLLWAVGQTEKLGLITSFSMQDQRVAILSDSLEAPVLMVRPENRFRVDPIPLDLFEPNRDWKALAVLTNVNQPGSLREVVDHLISADEQRELGRSDAGYRLIDNAWAKGQCILLVHSTNTSTFENFMKGAGRDLAARYDEALQAAIGPAVLAAGEDEDMESYIRRNFGFEIGIPKGYLTGEDAEGRVVRLYRVIDGEPARYVLVHWMPVAERPKSLEEFVALRDELGEVYYQGDHILEERSDAREGTFQDQPAWLIEGVWQNDRFVMGGPFRTFGFERGGRFYVVDAAVFNPPGSKLPYLREALAVARTFRVVEPS